MRDKHIWAGQTVKTNKGEDFRIEDWAENVLGCSVWKANGNPAAMIYGIRSGMEDLPPDNDVIYGKIGGMGVLLHASEIVQ